MPAKNAYVQRPPQDSPHATDDHQLARRTLRRRITFARERGQRSVVMSLRMAEALLDAPRARRDRERDAAEDRWVERTIERGLAWNREHGLKPSGPAAA